MIRWQLTAKMLSNLEPTINSYFQQHKYLAFYIFFSCSTDVCKSGLHNANECHKVES